MYLYRNARPQNSRIVYPHVALDPAYLSGITDIKTIYPLCRYFLSNPLIFAAIWKFSAYPITRILFDTSDDWMKERADSIFNRTLQLREFLFMLGLNYHAFGNSYYSIKLPTKKILNCTYCGHDTVAGEKNFEYRGGVYRVKCYNCRRKNKAIARDIAVQSVNDIALTRWDPSLIDTVYIPYMPKGQAYRYYLTIPAQIKNKVRLGDTRVIANLPESFIKAIKDNKRLESKGGIRHMRRPSFSRGTRDDGLGIPVMFASLQLGLTFQLLMKHLEAAIIDHTLPYRAISPKTGRAAELTGISVTEATDALEEYLAEVRKNPNFIGVVPPFDSVFIGGQVDPLKIIKDFQAFFDILIAGLGFPREFVFGGLSWSGSSVSMRMLENSANDYRASLKVELRYIVETVLRFMNLPIVEADLEKFKMADDLQRAAFDSNLAREGTLSWETVLEERDHDPILEKERLENQFDGDLKRLRQQRTMMARANGEASIESAKYQAKSGRMMAIAQFESQMEIQRRQQEEAAQQPQPQMPPPGQPQGPGGQGGPPPQGEGPPQPPPGGAPGVGVPIPPAQAPQAPTAPTAGGGPQQSISQLSDTLLQMPAYERRLRLAELRAEDWQLYSSVLKKINEGEPSQLPLPEQKPPRRGPEKAII